MERCIHQIVIKVDHGYAPSLIELKGLLEAKEKIEEYARESAKVSRYLVCHASYCNWIS